MRSPQSGWEEKEIAQVPTSRLEMVERVPKVTWRAGRPSMYRTGVPKRNDLSEAATGMPRWFQPITARGVITMR